MNAARIRRRASEEMTIQDKDFVLFLKNREIEYCSGKIVIAEILDIASPPQLVIKRLIRLVGDKVPGKEGYEEEPVLYVLRSESSDVNPQTGKMYEDIPISDDERVRIVGEVVAIARPIS